MRTHLETLEKWISEYQDEVGNRYHPIPPELSEVFEKQRNAFNRRRNELYGMMLRDRKIEICHDFTDDPACDAVADVYEYLGIIVMTKGGVMLPIDMFYRIFSHPEFMPGLGNSRIERINPQHRDGLLNNFDELVRRRKNAGRILWPIHPNCPTRFETANMCAEIVWGFMMLHEIVHIVHGHIGWMRRKMPPRQLIKAFKANYQAIFQPNDTDLQALELWADNKAIGVSLGGFITKRWNSELWNSFPTTWHKVFIWCFAMHTLFRLWGLKADPSNLGGDHPPTAIRFQMAIIVASMTVSHKFPDFTDEQFAEAMNDGIRASEKAIAYCGGKRLNPDDVANIRERQVIEHREKLLDHFDMVLRSELPAYSHVDITTEVA